jgi:hypothetical protein
MCHVWERGTCKKDTVGCSQSCDRAYSSFQLNLPSRLTLLFNSVLGVTKFAATFSEATTSGKYCTRVQLFRSFP